MSSLPYALSDKTITFSKDVLHFCETIKPTIITRSMIDQLVRSATSVGANYAEANNAASRLDFRNKIFIAKKEVAETKYWLQLMEEYAPNQDILLKLKSDCHYLLMTFQKIISTLKSAQLKQ